MEILDVQKHSAFPVLDPLTFPTNEGNFCVRDRLIADIRDSKSLKIVTGYAGMEELIGFISEYAFNQEIEIVIGHEPSMTTRKSAKQSPGKIADEMREYWLKRGFSPRTNASVLDAIHAIESGRVRTKIHTERFLHAKATVTDTAATFGSSNFSSSGLEYSRELNGRHLFGEREFEMINGFANACWQRSENFDDRFLELLKELQLYITWEEALARACAALLEGQWAVNSLSPELKLEFQKLWPHQQQAVAQTLTLAETQGSAVIADPTGSGKTRILAWAFRLAYNRMISKGGEKFRSLIPVMVAPSSVENNWYEALDNIGCPREIISMGLLSNSKKASTKRRLKLIGQTNLIGVDEIHNYYNENSNRTRALNSTLAESRIFATATPINRGFGDLITLMKLLGTEDLDSETVGKMKNLEERIKDPNPAVREQSVKESKDLIGRFMVRRTRDELKSLAKERPDEYKIGEKVANYPEYASEEYPIGSINDESLISLIEEEVGKIIGISRISKIVQTKAEFQSGISEERTLQGRLCLAAASSQWWIWKMLDSSPAALFEHILGTEAAEEKYQLKSGKSSITKSPGVVKKLESHPIPEWGLSADLRDSGTVPEWITNDEIFEEYRKKEIETYKSILELSLRLSDYRVDSKLKIIEESYKEHGKPLAFDTSIITLAYFRKKLEGKSIETHVFSGGGSKGKKKKVEEAEGLFGLHSDDTPRIGLLSDSMSEGINLQGSNVLIHLTYPTTVRKAEQRVGRVDRMDTKFEGITIYYPERDAISNKMKAHLKERSKLVSDIIGSNIKLPGIDDDFDEIPDSKEVEMTSSELNESMFANREGLFDAFHNVRKLIGEDGIISPDVYEMMRTSEAKVVSCVGLVRAEKPWCFAVIQTNKDWAPQWIYLDWTRKGAKRNSGIVTDTDEVCRLLRDNLEVAENLEPSNHSDIVIGEYLDHLSKKEIQLLPMRRKALLKQMHDVIIHWCRTKFGWNNEVGEKLRPLAYAANGNKVENLDMRQLATQWVSFVKEHREKYPINNSTSKRNKQKTINLLKDNPPEDVELFLERFSNVEEAEEFDTRVVALIAGIPDMRFWE